MGIAPDHWGPYVWAAIHLICMGAPDVLSSADQLNYKTFFNNLANVIPCDICRTHLKENLEKFPIDPHLATKNELVKWSIDLHNLVNSQLGKPVVAFEVASKKWRDVCDNKHSNGVLDGGTALVKTGCPFPLTGTAFGVGILIGGALAYYTMRHKTGGSSRR